MKPLTITAASVLLAGLLTLAPPATRPSPPRDGQTRAERVFLEGEWQQIGGVPPSLDSGLQNPLMLAAAGDLLYVFDYGDLTLKSFDLDGGLRWTFGGRGEGPREFSNPTDLALDEEGNVWVLDASNARITVVRPDGTLERMARLSGSGHRMFVFPDGSYWLTGTSGPEVLAERYTPGGERTGAVAAPDFLAEVDPLVSEGWTAVAPGSSRPAMAFLYSDHFLVWNRGRSAPPDVYRGIEPQPFPPVLEWEVMGGRARRVHPDARKAALNVAASPDSLYVLYHGTTDRAGRIIDIYTLDDGVYQGSYLLPVESHTMVRWSQGVALLIRDPIPEVRVLEWVDAEGG